MVGLRRYLHTTQPWAVSWVFVWACSQVPWSPPHFVPSAFPASSPPVSRETPSHAERPLLSPLIAWSDRGNHGNLHCHNSTSEQCPWVGVSVGMVLSNVCVCLVCVCVEGVLCVSVCECVCEWVCVWVSVWASVYASDCVLNVSEVNDMQTWRLKERVRGCTLVFVAELNATLQNILTQISGTGSQT